MFVYVWQGGCMAVAWLARRVERRRLGWLLSRLLVWLAGYGAVTCAVGFDAIIKGNQRCRGKVGQDREDRHGGGVALKPSPPPFGAEVHRAVRYERFSRPKALLVMVIVTAVLAAHVLLFS